MKKFSIALLSIVFALAVRASTFTFIPTDAIAGDANHNDLGDLSHSNAYTWGISSSTLKSELALGLHITGAVLTIRDIYNWDVADTSNQLFIHLLDNSKLGVKTVVDDPNDNGINQGVLSDYFSGKISSNIVNGKYVAYGLNNNAAGTTIATGGINTYLTQYHDGDGPNSVTQLIFALDAAQLSALNGYITNGHTGGTSYADFGLGFDPDCHYYNNGVQFVITTASQPIGNNQVPDGGVTLALLVLGCGAMAISRRMIRR